MSCESSQSQNVVLEASTQTPTNEDSESPVFSKNGQMHKSANHCETALSNIYKMRQTKQLCDITLQVGVECIQAHKVVLASVSPYFFAMFNGDLKEHDSPLVTLHEVDHLALELLVEYAYTGQVLITEDNVQVLLPASGLLQIEGVREACCKFLMKQLHPSNCLGIRTFADIHSCKELHSRSHCYALQNFQQVVNTEEFLLLPIQEVEDLISNGQLNISSEEDVFTAVLNWVKHDLSERQQYISQLMVHVRLPLVNRDFLMTRVDCERLVRENSQCRELLLEAMRYHLAPERRCALSTPRTAERKPSGAQPYLFAVGGGSLFAIHSECECYNPRTDTWTPIAPMLWRRSRSGVTGLRRMLYVVGGYDGASDLVTVECYNPLSNTWSTVTPLGTKRSSLGFSSFDGLIYVCGGYDGASCLLYDGASDLATVECYNPLSNTWSTVTPMGTKRSCLGISSFDGLIYVCGGYDGASCLASMERFDPLTGVWCSCPAMNTRRRYCRTAVVENCVYALGGFDSTNYQASVERFDPRQGHWQPVPSMSSRRSSCGVAALDGALYCIGGNDGTMCMSSGERFNVRRNAWEPITAMNSRRSTHEVVGIDGFIYAIGGNDGSSSLNSVEKYDPKLNKWSTVMSMVTRRSSVGAAILECIDIEQILKQVKV